jgi:hypothetical protein
MPNAIRKDSVWCFTKELREKEQVSELLKSFQSLPVKNLPDVKPAAPFNFIFDFLDF